METNSIILSLIEKNVISGYMTANHPVSQQECSKMPYSVAVWKLKRLKYSTRATNTYIITFDKKWKKASSFEDPVLTSSATPAADLSYLQNNLYLQKRQKQ